jgi:hypothetical protein
MQNPIIDQQGNKQWYHDGKYHREDGPAIESVNGYTAWFRDGKYHREDGPAIESAYGDAWYLHGQIYTEELFRVTQFNNRIKVNV